MIGTDRGTWSEALEGLNQLYVTYVPDLAVPQAASDIEALVNLVKQHNIEHVVLLSGRGEQRALNVEQVFAAKRR